MAPSTFGQPTYEGADPAAAGAGAGASSSGSEALQEAAIDINDPAFSSEALDVNLEADAYVTPPPPPDRAWRVRLKLLQLKDATGQLVDCKAAVWGNPPQKVLNTGCESHIIDPSGKFEGVIVRDMLVSTFMRRDKGTTLQSILRVLKTPDGGRYLTPGLALTPMGWVQLYLKAMATEPECGLETVWEWNCQACGEEADKRGDRRPATIKGMQKFWNAQQRQFVAEMRCPANPAHGYSRARATVGRYMTLEELAKLSAAGQAGQAARAR